MKLAWQALWLPNRTKVTAVSRINRLYWIIGKRRIEDDGFESGTVSKRHAPEKPDNDEQAELRTWLIEVLKGAEVHLADGELLICACSFFLLDQGWQINSPSLHIHPNLSQQIRAVMLEHGLPTPDAVLSGLHALKQYIVENT